MNIFNNVNTLEKSMDVASLRQRLISNNIANVETPGYKSMDVSFDDLLNQQMAKYDQDLSFQGFRTDPRHIQIGQEAGTYQPKIVVDNKTSILNNENNVDIDYEMTKLAENNIWYSALTQSINKEFSLLRYVVSEGRR